MKEKDGMCDLASLASILRGYAARLNGPPSQLAVYFLMPENVEKIRAESEARLRRALNLDYVVVQIDPAFETYLIETMISNTTLQANTKNLFALNERAVKYFVENGLYQIRQSAHMHRLSDENRPHMLVPEYVSGNKHRIALSSWDYTAHDPGKRYHDSYLKRVHGVKMKEGASGLSSDNFERLEPAAGYRCPGMHSNLTLQGGRSMTPFYPDTY